MTIENPNWNNNQDRLLYKKLMNQDTLDKKEKDFCVSMYHQEEFMSGLDGDRE